MRLGVKLNNADMSGVLVNESKRSGDLQAANEFCWKNERIMSGVGATEPKSKPEE